MSHSSRENRHFTDREAGSTSKRNGYDSDSYRDSNRRQYDSRPSGGFSNNYSRESSRRDDSRYRPESAQEDRTVDSRRPIARSDNRTRDMPMRDNQRGNNGSCTLFVGGISYQATENDLQIAFPTAERVRIQKDRDTGKSKGFGFIEFRSAEEARSALQNSSNVIISGRPIRVSEANGSGDAGGSSRPIQHPQSNPLTSRQRSRSRDYTRTVDNGSTDAVDEVAHQRRREERLHRMRERLDVAASGWDRRPTQDELRAQEEEANAIKSSNSRGEITTIRAELMKAAASRSGHF